jgi:hypothetical protein
MRLAAQDKLALIRTGFTSDRAMARALGVTHQKLGRWLREGLDGGVKKIPDDPFTQRAIDISFYQHRLECQRQALKDQIPYLYQAPAFMFRKFLKRTDADGNPEKGSRVFVEDAHFIRDDLRNEILIQAAKTGDYYETMIRSLVDLYAYLQRSIDDEYKIKKKRYYRREVAEYMTESIERKYGVIIDQPMLGYVTTPHGALHMDALRADRREIGPLNNRLKEKHEPATSTPGTKFADTFIIQMKLDIEPRRYARKKKQVKPKGTTKTSYRRS